jgi:hypothetical protein
MSRSVRQDYDKLREAQSEGKVIIPFKIPVVTVIPWEAIFDDLALSDQRYARKSTAVTVSPTNMDWALYHRAKAGLLALRSYKNTEGLEHLEIPMPKPETQYHFTETAEAWLDRCHALYAERTAA